MKKFKKYLALFLAVLSALASTSVSVTTVAEAAEGAYTVLCEPNIPGGVLQGTYSNVAVVGNETYALWEYSAGSVKQITDGYLWDSKMDNPGFSASGYVALDNGYREDVALNYRGELVASGDYIDFPTDDGYAFAATYQEDDTEDYILNLETGTSFPLTYRRAYSMARFNNGLIPIELIDESYHATYQYVDESMNIVLPGPYTRANEFSNGYAVVGVPRTGSVINATNIINTTGKVILSSEDIEMVSDISGSVSHEGLVRVCNSSYSLFGYMNLSGELIIPRSYGRQSRDFSNGYAVVYNDNNQCGLIDTKGDIIVPFGTYKDLSNVSDTGLVWASNKDTDGNWTVSAVLKVGTASPVELDAGEYIYDVPDPGEDVELNIDRLNRVTDMASAVQAVKDQVAAMTAEQKQSATGADLATLYAETAVSKAASKQAETGNNIVINAAAVSDLETIAEQTNAAVEEALSNGGVTTARYLSKTVTLTTDASDLAIQIDPDILDTNVDKVRVEAPSFALTFKLFDLEPDLTEALTFTARAAGGTVSARQAGRTFSAKTLTLDNELAMVEIGVPRGSTSNPITVSLPSGSGDKTYQAVANSEGSATASKYNPATGDLDGKVNKSGTYTMVENKKDFTDISNKSTEMQNAIRYLASKGIITGTTEATFSPNGSISRAEIAQLIVKALGKMDSSASASFKDVSRKDWYYAAAACSQKHGIIKGYDDNTFRGTTVIPRDQITAVSARVLKTEMGYKTPSSPTKYLSQYKDTVATWAQPEVALATRENLVVKRTDGKFAGTKNMTRGDAAIIIYRLFQKIW